MTKELDNPMCECGHRKSHHRSRLKKGFNKQFKKEKPLRICDGRFCKCKKFKLLTE